MDIPTKGVGSTLLTPQVGAFGRLDGQGGMMRHVTEHIRARNKADYGAALYKNKQHVLPSVAVKRPRMRNQKAKFAPSANNHGHVSASLSECSPTNHLKCLVSFLLCRLYYVVFVMCIAAHNSTLWTYFYFLFLCHMSTSGLEVICAVTSCL
jgi:hypothetical protein